MQDLAPVDVVKVWPARDEIFGRCRNEQTWDIPLELALAISPTMLKSYILQLYAAGKVKRDCRVFVRVDGLYGCVQYVGSDNWIIIDLNTKTLVQPAVRSRQASSQAA